MDKTLKVLTELQNVIDKEYDDGYALADAIIDYVANKTSELKLSKSNSKKLTDAFNGH
jgi:hypothetical protein